jgi:hypothetical protein
VSCRADSAGQTIQLAPFFEGIWWFGKKVTLIDLFKFNQLLTVQESNRAYDLLKIETGAPSAAR